MRLFDVKNHTLYDSIIMDIIDAFLVFTLLKSHVPDGNVFGIYIENGSLLIGDFWGAVIVILLTAQFIAHFRNVIEKVRNDGN